MKRKYTRITCGQRLVHSRWDLAWSYALTLVHSAHRIIPVDTSWVCTSSTDLIDGHITVPCKTSRMSNEGVEGDSLNTVTPLPIEPHRFLVLPLSDAQHNCLSLFHHLLNLQPPFSPVCLIKPSPKQLALVPR